jgi:hypothetical protein
MALKLSPTKWAINLLKDHPRQTALAKDMDRNRLQKPVESLLDGTIIAGHQGVLAAKQLDWKKVEVVVRADSAMSGKSGQHVRYGAWATEQVKSAFNCTSVPRIR